MDETLPRYSSYGGGASAGRRGVSFVLALAANLLILVMLLRLASFSPDKREPERRTTVIDIPRDPEIASTRSRVPTRIRRVGGGGSAQRHTPAATPDPTRPPPTPTPATATWNVLALSHDEFAAADIGKMSHAAPAPGPAGGSGNGSGKGSGDDEGVGTGPGGEKLYNADWQTPPTRAELAYYLPRSAPETGWGMIACRTVPRFKVDDCVLLGESPVGSGFGRAVLDAAWQFHVLPPRIGGRAMVGSWVRIRIDYTDKGSKQAG